MNTTILHSLQQQTISYGNLFPFAASKFQSLSYAECEHIWSYGGKLILLSRNLLNAAARSSHVIFLAGSSFPSKMKGVITHMKLFSIVSVPFSVVDLKLTAQKLASSLFLKDFDGATMNSLSLSMLAADTFDSLSTFINSLLTVTEHRPIGILSSLALPISFFIAGTGTVFRTIQIAKNSNLYQKLNPSFFLETKHTADLKNDLLKKIPKDAIPSLERLFELLGTEETESVKEEILKSIKTIQLHLEKKMNIDGIGILANLIVISALFLFYAGTANSLPFLLMALALTIRLMSLTYQDNKLKGSL